VALGKAPMDRPLTHDLCISLLCSLKGRLKSVELMDLRDGTYYADLVLSLENGETHRLDCRPSDAVALALRAHVPIRASRALLQRTAELQRSADAPGGNPVANVPIQKLAVELHVARNPGASSGQGKEQDRFAELLRQLEPESKRKM
jgi:bifunctional DNase/RNase